MSECSFCGALAEKHYPLCHACGALRYPVTKISPPNITGLQKKLKLSASVAVAIVVPGALLVLAAMGVNRLHAQRKKRKL